MIGTVVSHYKILSKLGEGGMGVVYEAQDTTLDRLVALKFLPAHLNASEQDKARFIQEAKAASALNHPNVCTIHAIEEHDGQLFIVMEFVDGQTLRQKAGSISYKQALDIGIQIADGLAAAHDKGIVHRDIKPENIMIRKDGIAQIMDFGLAKLRTASSKINRLTKEGSTVGTAGYMSPEQVQGHDVDHRSDIFSFGVVLYEMFTGQLPFKGVHETALLYEIVNVDASPMTTVKSEIDPALDAVVMECLMKEPAERSQSVAEVGKDLRHVKRESSKQRMSRTFTAVSAQRPAPAAAPAAARRSPLMAWLPWGIAGALLLALLYLLMRPAQAPVAARQLRASLVVPDSLYVHTFGFWSGPPAVSHDGASIVFSGVSNDGLQQLYLRKVDGLESLPIEGTRLGYSPFWSPDDRYIGFFTTDGKLKKVEAAGGQAITLSGVRNPRGGTWGASNTIIFTLDFQQPLFRISSDGGTPEQVTTLDSLRHESSHRYPSFLPDGTHFLYFSRVASTSGDAEGMAVFVGSVDKSVNKLVVHTNAQAMYASGRLLFMRGTTLLAQEMDERTFELSGTPVTIAEQVTNDPSFNLAVFSASQTGVLTYQTGVCRAGARLLLVDRTGKQLGTLGELAEQFRPRFSPDGKKIASSYFDIRTFRLNVWSYELGSGAHNRVTTGSGEDFPVWSPDGSRLAYAHRSVGVRQAAVYMKTLAQSGSEEFIFSPTNQVVGAFFGPTDWSPDGSMLLVSGTRYEAGTSDIMTVAATGAHEGKPFLKTEFGEWDARFSRDGKWVAYTSNESGEEEIYVRRYGATDNRLWKISASGGVFPRWGKGSEDLLYVSKENKLMQATLRYSADGVAIAATRTLFAMPPFLEDYDVSHDGATIVINRYLEVRRTTTVTIVNNWMGGLNKE